MLDYSAQYELWSSTELQHGYGSISDAPHSKSLQNDDK